MYKKDILFVIVGMDTGGIPSSLLCLLQELEKRNLYNIDIICFAHIGKKFQDLEKYHVLPEDKNLRLIGISQKKAFEENLLYGIKRFVLGGVAKYIFKGIAYDLIMKDYKNSKKYDVAISFMHSKYKSLYGGTNEFVLKKIAAKKKVTFIHGDFLNAKLNTDYNYRIYGKFDAIASVSRSCKKIFDQTWPDYEFKSFVVENCINIEEIKRKSEVNTIEYKKNIVQFVTVARICKEKGFDRTIHVLSRLKKLGYDFRWHVIGGNGDSIEEKITEEGLYSEIVLYGEKKNPYRYVKNADAFLLLSYQEAAPIVIQEAICLNVPVISTNTLSAKELVGENGIIVDNNEESIFAGLKNILDHPEILNNIKNNIKNEFGNEKKVKQFERIM